MKLHIQLIISAQNSQNEFLPEEELIRVDVKNIGVEKVQDLLEFAGKHVSEQGQNKGDDQEKAA